MKCSEYAIEQFKKICRDEQDTMTELVKYKLLRAYNLGTYIEARGEERFVMGFGSLRLEVNKSMIVDVWRSKKCYPVNKYAKYTYDFEHGVA